MSNNKVGNPSVVVQQKQGGTGKDLGVRKSYAVDFDKSVAGKLNFSNRPDDKAISTGRSVALPLLEGEQSAEDAAQGAATALSVMSPGENGAPAVIDLSASGFARLASHQSGELAELDGFSIERNLASIGATSPEERDRLLRQYNEAQDRAAALADETRHAQNDSAAAEMSTLMTARFHQQGLQPDVSGSARFLKLDPAEAPDSFFQNQLVYIGMINNQQSDASFLPRALLSMEKSTSLNQQSGTEAMKGQGKALETFNTTFKPVTGKPTPSGGGSGDGSGGIRF